MILNNEIYVKYADENGEQYYCPIISFGEGDPESGHYLDDCVEASTVGRYLGNLNVVD